jgi:hypothetical protein
LGSRAERLLIATLKEDDELNWGPYGQGICAELVAMAVVARKQNSEPPLTRHDIVSFVGPLSRFLNSWVHE